GIGLELPQGGLAAEEVNPLIDEHTKLASTLNQLTRINGQHRIVASHNRTILIGIGQKALLHFVASKQVGSTTMDRPEANIASRPCLTLNQRHRAEPFKPKWWASFGQLRRVRGHGLLLWLCLILLSNG